MKEDELNADQALIEQFRGNARAETSAIDLDRPGIKFDMRGVEQYPLTSKAITAIMDWENSSDPRKFNSKPEWPGASSGVTIGFGYDLRWKDKKELHRDWSGVLDERTLERLTKVIGMKGQDAKSAAQKLDDIDIPYAKARHVLENKTLPLEIKNTISIYPEAKYLPPDSFSALVSMVFNRGRQLNVEMNPNDDYKTREEKKRQQERLTEKRFIQTALKEGNLDGIPGFLSDMKKRTDLEGVKNRRDAEAALFKEGLDKKRGLVRKTLLE